MADMEPIHPGEHLAEILGELGITPYRLAKTIGVAPRHINEIVAEPVNDFETVTIAIY